MRIKRSHKGFTLVETMMALLILVILTGIVAMGIPVATKTYAKAVDGSNAQTLLSTTASVMREQLDMAQDVDTLSDGTVLHYVTSTGHWAALVPTGSNDQARIQRHDYLGVLDNLSEVEGSPIDIVTDATITEGFGITYDSLTYENGVFTVHGLRVMDDRGAVVARIGTDAGNEFKIQALMLSDGSEG